MPQIEPFRGILYDSKKVKLANVVAPPYDVISPQMQDELYRAAPHNIVRLILGKEESSGSKTNTKYKRAGEYFVQWLKDGVLVQDRAPSIYIYSQEYTHNGRKKRRLGFIARMKIEDPRTSRVFPHEYTFSKPKQDRLNLIREVKANLCSIFALFQDKDGKAKKILEMEIYKRPLFDLEYEGVRHKFWKLVDKALIKKIQALMLDKEIYIADGHHRYEVALMYRDEMRRRERKNRGYDYVMMYFTPMNREGMTILSTHRLLKCVEINIDELLKAIKTYFYIKRVKTEKTLFEKMRTAKKEERVFGVYFRDRPPYFLKLKEDVCLDGIIKEDKSGEWKRLDVSILHGIIFNNILGLREKALDEGCIVYTRDPDYAISEVKKGNYAAAFFLNPTKVSQVQSLARRGDRMPHKSTYFYPKLLSGLVINKLE